MSGVTRLVLVGMMGAGKSTVGAVVADRLGMEFVDLDRWIERDAKMSVAEIFALEGEDGFRRREVTALREVLASVQPSVIAAGGGIVTSQEARSLLGTVDEVVLLEVSAEVAAQRLAGNGTRPLLHDDARATLAQLKEARDLAYREVATHQVGVDGLTPGETADAVLEIVGSTP